MTTLDVTWSNQPLFWLSSYCWLMATAALPDPGDEGCVSDSAGEAVLLFFYFFSLFSSTSLCLFSLHLFISDTSVSFSCFCASSISHPLIWGNWASYTVADSPGETGSGICSSSMDWEWELADLHFLCRYHTTTVEPTHNQGTTLTTLYVFPKTE